MKSKVDAIFDLRDAAEEHGRAVAALVADPGSPLLRELVLDVRSKLEAATADAIDSCHHCDKPHRTEDHV